MSRIAVVRALISVSDKRGLTPFAEALVNNGVEIVSSGGTADHLADAGIPVTRVEEVTGVPEMFGGRVKTLHPRIHGGVLADLGKDDHRQDLVDNGIQPFQLVVTSLYPFEETVAGGADHAGVIEQIDIGGPALIRAAAKNHAWVAVVVSPDRYPDIVRAVSSGGTTAQLRLELAREAFSRTASYDAAIVSWFGRDTGDEIVLRLTRAVELRYGENPHQEAGLYCTERSSGWWNTAEIVQGKDMSFNNYADADAAWRLVMDLPERSVAILKHTNACGAARGPSMLDNFRNAWACDPLSAFGGVIACHGEIDGPTALAISENFVEIVMALSVNEEGLAVLARKKNVRVIVAHRPSAFDLDIRSIDDGFLIQKLDRIHATSDTWDSRGRVPSPNELTDLEMAWIIAAHTKSNAVVLVKDGAAVGVGAGDQSRIGAAERALAKAGERARGSVCASDAFFPFRDGPDTLGAAGITAIVQPGGSIKDDEVIEAANEHDMSLMFTGERHFKH